MGQMNLLQVFDEPILPPGTVGRLTNINLDHIREWRRLGLLSDYGTQGQNGRWQYSVRDAVGFWMAERFSVRGLFMERGPALKRARQYAPSIMFVAMDFHLGREPNHAVHQRYAIELMDGYSDGMRVHGGSLKRVQSLVEIADEEFDRAEIIDTWRIARTMPAELRGYVVSRYEVYRDLVEAELEARKTGEQA
jgi:hypothetical protein